TVHFGPGRLEWRWHAGKNARTLFGSVRPLRGAGAARWKLRGSLVKQSHKTLLLCVLLIMMFLALWQFLIPERTPTAQVSYTDFLVLVDKDKDKEHVESVTIKDREITFYTATAKGQQKTKKITTGPDGKLEDLTKKLVDKGITVTFEKEDSS